MKKTNIFILALLLIGTKMSLNAQDSNELCLNIRTERLLIGVDNPLVLVYPQNKPITKSDIKVEFTHWKTKETYELEIKDRDGFLSISPNDIGYVTVHVSTEDGIKTRKLQTKSIIATGKLSKYGNKFNGKISPGEFRAQLGIMAVLENYDIGGKCRVLSFETIRISDVDLVQRKKNIGGKFDKSTREIIALAASGDLYCFRKIMYKCAGDKYEKRLGDMTFDIK